MSDDTINPDPISIPTYNELYLPTLMALESFDGPVGNEELDARVCELAGVTDAQRAIEFGPEQTQKVSKVAHRLAWARTYLKKSELIENPQRATWVITVQGRDVAALPKQEAREVLAALDKEIRRSSTNRDLNIRRGSDPAFEPVYEAATLWRDMSLVGARSLFAADKVVWTEETANDLATRFIEGADEGDRSFSEKLQDQFRGATQNACSLMAELMFIHLLPLVNVTLATKRRNIDLIGSWAPQPFEAPASFDEALGLGIFNGGAGFNTGRPNHLRFLIRMVQRWVAVGGAERQQIASDPWAFKEFLYDLPLDGATSQRNALLLMLFPAHFEDISARDHKLRIVAAFPGLVGESADIDRQLLALRQAKTADFGDDFSWYREDIRAMWDKKTPKAARSSRPESAAEVLSHLFAEEADRQIFATTMAEAIRVANAVNPKSWGISSRSGGIHLNVGPNRTLSIQSAGLGAALPASTAGELQQRPGLDQADVSEKAYVFPTDVSLITIEPKYAAELLTAVGPNLMEVVKATATRDTPYWKSHSGEALDLLRELSGLKIPDPPDRGLQISRDQRAWIVRVKREEGGVDSAGSLERGDTRIFWPVDVPPRASVEVIKDALRVMDPNLSNHSLGNQAGSIHRFITRTQVGDVVLMPDGSDLYLGVIAGDAEFQNSEREWARPVEWLEEPIDRSEVSAALYSRLRSLLTITEITPLLPELLAYLADGIEGEGPVVAAVAADVRLAPIDDDLAKDWMLDRDWLSEIVGLLQRKRQLIFYGPPGTGKTFLAERLAGHLTSDGGSYKLVQFHPSYSYEDFVEGFRPRVDSAGNLTYELTPGPLRLLADAARENPGEPYLLIIDEINRGNLAKIFGELYYLLEYREQSLVLQYGSSDEDEFSLPENLFVIGTMNTADRSIAMVDAAIRRRFNFVEFSPTKPPISGLLSEWLPRNGGGEEPALLLEALNRLLDDDDYSVGPSYLMNDDAKTQAGLERIWKYSIMPLLVEHFYGQRGATDRFELKTLQKVVRRAQRNESSVPSASLEESELGDSSDPS